MWTDYWRIVKPETNKTKYTPQDYNEYSSSYANWTWYAQIMKGSAARMQKYNQFNNMDSDVDISRALDTIAEEMTNRDENSDLPFEIVYQNEANQEVDESIVITLRAALRHWNTIHCFDGMTFDIARNVVKYGDCFFRKSSDFKKWQYLDPTDIIGVELDSDMNIVSYHIRKGEHKQGQFGQVLVLPASAVVHFTLASGATALGPFGESVLTTVVKAYKQLLMLEDSVIIYRIVRAPERRVFFIDTGNMPPHKSKQYLENLKNEIRQKRIPNNSGGQETVDGTYNPMSMLEDYFFATSASGRGSRVETLPGGENLGEITDLNYFQNKVFRGLRIPSSYMRGSQDGGSQTNDGKVGIAYIEELRFANFIKRLQNKIEGVFDKEFKTYLKAAKINVDNNLFKLKMPDPSNFAIYKQAMLDSELINTFNAIENIDYVSKRYALKRYLGWTEEDVQINESMLRQERNVPENGYDELSDIQMFYDPKWKDSRPDIVVPSEMDDTGDQADSEEPPADEAPAEPSDSQEPDTKPDAGASEPSSSDSGDGGEMPNLG